MRWLLALALVACQPVEAAPPTPAPTPLVVYVTPAPTPIPTPWVPALDPRRVVVAVGLEAATQERGTRILDGLPAAWLKATQGRSTMTLVAGTDLAPIYLTIRDRALREDAGAVRGLHSAHAGRRIHVIDIYRPAVDATDARVMKTVLHELAHALGCCSGPGGHWADCDDEIMCHTSGTRDVFSDRELAQMGL